VDNCDHVWYTCVSYGMTFTIFRKCLRCSNTEASPFHSDDKLSFRRIDNIPKRFEDDFVYQRRLHILNFINEL
jgi:hypothetical protein